MIMNRLITEPAIPVFRSRSGSLRHPPFIHTGHGVFDGQPLPVHRHDFAEIVVVLSGEARCVEDGRVFSLRPGDVVVAVGDTAHGFLETRKFEISNVAFCLHVLKPHERWLRRLPGYATLFHRKPKGRESRSLRKVLHLQPHDLGLMADWLRAMEAETRAPSAGYEVALTGLLLQVVTALSRACVPPPPPAEADPDARIARAIRHMEEHYAEHLTLADLATVAHASPSTLLRLFQRAVGVAPIDYLIRMRIWKACELLGDPALSIKDITFDVGFNDTNYFTRQFCRVMRMPPGKYRVETHRPGAVPRTLPRS